MEIFVFARLHARPGKQGKVQQAMFEVQGPTRKEPGCLSYGGFRSVRDPDEFDAAFAAMTAGRSGAVVVLSDPMFFVHRTRLADLAVKHRLPTMHGVIEFAGAGGLMAYYPSSADQYRRAATYIDKILKGAKPSDLPVDRPERLTLAINLKTAQALGLTIPQTILLQADQVIE